MGTLTIVEHQPVVKVRPSLEDWSLEGQVLFDTFNELVAANRVLTGNANRVSWLIGDWLLEGEEQFKEEAIREAQRITKKSISTLWDFIRTAKAFKDHSRRRDLSWSHHKEVALAKFDAEKQDQLLAYAENNKLSVQNLRLRAKAIEKGIDKRVDKLNKPKEEWTHKSVKITVPKDSFKWVRKLSEARRRPVESLLYDIVCAYFAKNKGTLEKEIQEYEAPIKAARQEQKKANEKVKSEIQALRETPRNKAAVAARHRIKDLEKDVKNRTGEDIGWYIRRYYENNGVYSGPRGNESYYDCAYRTGLASMSATEELIERLDQVEDLQAKVGLIKQLAFPRLNLPEIKLRTK